MPNEPNPVSARSERRLRAGACLALVMAGAVVALVATGAWACVPQPRLVVITPQASGPAGSQVTVQGIGFDSPPSTTEIRWNTAEGPVLGRSDSADFSVAVTVPEVGPGTYGVLVMSRGADGVLGNAARATFEVTGGAATEGGSTRAPAVAASPATSPGPTFAPAPTVVAGSSGPSGVSLALVALALLAAGVFVGTLIHPRATPVEAPP